jgi:hypothetical protein
VFPVLKVLCLKPVTLDQRVCLVSIDNIIEISKERVVDMFVAITCTLFAVLSRDNLLNKGTKVPSTALSMLL